MGCRVSWNEQRISRQLKLRDLHVLMTVATCGSMGKAASRLSVSQPAISKAIADMEIALGVKLLDRSPRGVVPTIYARALLERGLVAFDELKQVSSTSISWQIPQPENFASAAPSQLPRAFFPPSSIGFHGNIRAWSFIYRPARRP